MAFDEQAERDRESLIPEPIELSGPDPVPIRSVVKNVPVEPALLEIGKRYRVEFDDCCIHGVLTATYRGRQIEDGDPLDYLFDDAAIGYDWAHIRFYGPLPDVNDPPLAPGAAWPVGDN